jgi:hypothetical protein
MSQVYDHPEKFSKAVRWRLVAFQGTKRTGAMGGMA